MNMPKIPARELSKFSLVTVCIRSIIQDHCDCRVEFRVNDRKDLVQRLHCTFLACGHNLSMLCIHRGQLF